MTPEHQSHRDIQHARHVSAALRVALILAALLILAVTQ
jgi:hypothetical protein